MHVHSAVCVAHVAKEREECGPIQSCGFSEYHKGLCCACVCVISFFVSLTVFLNVNFVNGILLQCQKERHNLTCSMTLYLWERMRGNMPMSQLFVRNPYLSLHEPGNPICSSSLNPSGAGKTGLTGHLYVFPVTHLSALPGAPFLTIYGHNPCS